MTVLQGPVLAGAESIAPGLNLSWDRFAAEHWEKSPRLFTRGTVRPLMAPEAMFNALVRVAEEYRAADEPAVPVRFYMGHSQVVTDTGSFLPRYEDETLEGYEARVLEELNGQSFGLVVEEFQAYDVDLWFALREFLRTLEQETGIRVPSVKSTLFVGNYPKTPFGLHKGTSSNFKFIIQGRKKVSLWPDTYFAGRKEVSHTARSEPYMDDAATLDANVGDIVYWPSDSWHTAECVDGVAATLSLALFPNAHRSLEKDVWQQILATAESHIASSPGERVNTTDAADIAAIARAVPSLIDQITTELGRSLLDPEVIEQLCAKLLNRSTSSGFNTVPPARADATLAMSSRVAANAHFPIVHVQVERETVLCSANGHTFALPAHQGMMAMLDELNAGGTFGVDELVRRYAGTSEIDGVEIEADPDDILEVLTKLYSLRAIRSVDSA